jgi:squalene-hopene/tetraprenyl-beta-curcumene cyclase
MNLEFDVERLTLAHKAVRAELLAERAPGGYWVGQLAGSPFSTAAAVSALVVAHRRDSQCSLDKLTSNADQVAEQVVQGDLSELLLECVHWLARCQNEDGGWADCVGARSNIAATMMVQAAFRLTGIPARYADLMDVADEYVKSQGGLAGLRRYLDDDRTMLAAVLANCALADMVAWRQVPTLQLELACLSKRWKRDLQFFAARYSTPVVLAVGGAKFRHDPPKNPISRLLRQSIWKKSLTILEQLQASDDSFLASVPLTSFVVMSLGSVGCQDHQIVRRGIEFLLSNIRADSSWAHVPNRATSNTALALNSLSAGSNFELEHRLSPPTSGHTWEDTASANDTLAEIHSHHAEPNDSYSNTGDDGNLFREDCLNWLVDHQRTEPNAVTEVSAGGWASSDAAGAPPNTLATATVLIALVRSQRHSSNFLRERVQRACGKAVVWLLDLQNEDGSWATFYRDDSMLQRDESGTDVTAQVVRALATWRRDWQADPSPETRRRWAFIDERVLRSIDLGWKYLEARQQKDGRFIPLWFGNEHQPEGQNPVAGTSQVLLACAELERVDTELAQRAARWLIGAQHANGGWGPPRTPVDYSVAEKDGTQSRRSNEEMAKFCTVEETSLAISALMGLADSDAAASQAVSRGLTWLINAIEQDGHRRPSTVGFSLAKLWYHDRLYPLAFAAGALSRAVRELPVKLPSATHVG